MARELECAGFAVTMAPDLEFRSMVRRIEPFTSRIKGGDHVVVYYAGHGIQLKTGSYLLPTDSEPKSESKVAKTSYSLNEPMDKLSEARASFSLVLIDAISNMSFKLVAPFAKQIRTGTIQGTSCFLLTLAGPIATLVGHLRHIPLAIEYC